MAIYQDYDRLQFCSKPVQLAHFERQLEMSKLFRKPLFLHCRNAYAYFFEIMNRHHGKLHGGVVHSFTGSKEEAKLFTDLGYYIGINGFVFIFIIILVFICCRVLS